MKKLMRVLCLMLCLCLLPLSGLAWSKFDTYEDPVLRSEFTLSFHLHADGFPTEGVTAHVADWESFLNKISIKGTVDRQNPFQIANVEYLKGSICLNGEEQFPFVYDRTHYYRYFYAPKLGQKALHWNMADFYEFCYKGYYYYEFPMLAMGLLLYPESTTQMIEGYYRPIENLLNSKEGTCAFTYEELQTAVEELQTYYDNNPHDTYYYLTAVFEPLWMYDEVDTLLSDPQALLDRLDPEKKGMTVTEKDGTRTYVLGDIQVFTRTENEEGTSFALNLPLAENLCAKAEYSLTKGNLNVKAALVGAEDEERLCMVLAADGLPTEGVLKTQGSVSIAFTGTAIEQAYRELPDPVQVNFSFERTGETLPYSIKLAADFLHPETGKPSVTVDYDADLSEQDPSVIVKTQYDATESVFGLNESVVDELKEAFAKPLILAAVPFVLELPLNCMDDMLMFLNDNGVVELIFKDVLP